ncbi:MAG: GTP cyclohydrolase II [Rhodospirillaceae bacterium]
MVRSTADIVEIPASRAQPALLAVERAISELRRGRFVAVRGNNGSAALALACEGVTPEALKSLSVTAGAPAALSITARRARVLGIAKPETTVSAGRIVTLSTEPVLSAETAAAIADPLAAFDAGAIRFTCHETQTYDSESAAVMLAKLARLLPAALTAPVDVDDADDLAGWALRHDLMLIDSGDVFQYDKTAARSLRQVSEAGVPLADAENTRVIAFRPRDGGLEHLAIVVGEPKPGEPVLARIHSECFTGDLLGSLRCDCGDQLRGAIQEIGRAGAGVLLYLAQEGRGIGLINKLRAYALQDQGFDTMDANEQLGFDADERIYLPAAQMLRLLGFDKVRLMTNNPLKVDALTSCGVQVAERVAHSFPSNKHNEHYLKTKATRGGHIM